MIFYYIVANKLTDEFDKLVKTVSINEKFINMKPFSPFIINFVRKFGEIEQNEVMVLRVSASRFFFDRFYLLNSNIYNYQPELSTFLQNCALFSKKTPHEYFVPEKYVRDGEYDLSFAEIVKNNQILHSYLEELLLVSFYTYPADILQCVYTAIKFIEKYAKTAILERKYGNNIDWTSEEAAEATSDLAFDDFFPIFCGFFSVSPPLNSLALFHLFSMIEKLVIPTSFDFAKIVFLSSIDHLMQIDKEEK